MVIYIPFYTHKYYNYFEKSAFHKHCSLTCLLYIHGTEFWEKTSDMNYMQIPKCWYQKPISSHKDTKPSACRHQFYYRTEYYGLKWSI